MSSLKKYIGNGHIQLALATGISIIVLAYVSKRMLAEPIGYLHLAIPPFLMTIWEALRDKHKNARYLKPVYWVLAIFAATAIVIAINA